MDRDEVIQLIADHEEKRYKAYPDSEGIMHVGIGMNLEERGAKERIEALGVDYERLCAGECELTEGHVLVLFDGNLNSAVADAARIIGSFWDLPDDVQHAMIDMSFQLGGPRFAKFKKMIAALEAKPPDYDTAVAEMLDSKWARQAPNRAQDDANLVRRHM
jgi:lysozyme